MNITNHPTFTAGYALHDAHHAVVGQAGHFMRKDSIRGSVWCLKRFRSRKEAEEFDYGELETPVSIRRFYR